MNEDELLHENLIAYLRAEPEYVELFGDRIYHEWAPQSVRKWPLLVISQVSGGEEAGDMDAPNDDKLETANYQFDVYARTSADCQQAAKRLNRVFRNFRGTMGAVTVQWVELGNTTHLGEIVGDKQIRRVQFDYVIYFNSRPTGA